MYVIIAPIQVKEGHKAAFIDAIIEDAKGSVNDEPGCLRFDVLQDAGDPNRVWLYEVYKDEAAFQAHTEAPHFIKFRDGTQDIRVEGIKGPARGSTNIWPPDAEWNAIAKTVKSGSGECSLYGFIVPVQIKDGLKDRFIEGIIEVAKGVVNEEPNCVRYDIIQDAGDPNRIWAYEVYTDEAALQVHNQSHYLQKFMPIVEECRIDSDQGAPLGSTNIWPSDSEWK